MTRTPFLPVPDPVAFTVFGLDIMWYALFMTGSICIGFALMYFRAKKKGLDPEHVLDLAIYCVPAGILGARLYYVLFRWDYYSADLSQILNLRGGGMAIHGSLIGGIGMAIYLFRKWKEPPLKWLDLAAVSFPLAQSIGRWGNYFNSEAHGGPTDLPWAIYADGEFVHPTFLYESIWCFLLFLFLLWFDESGKKSFDGQLICMYAALYSLERIFVEGLRTDSLMIGPFKQAQVISACAIAASIALYALFRRMSKSEKANR